MSPSSDIVGPSPVTSNGTETTEIEDDMAEGHAEGSSLPSVRLSTLQLHNRQANLMELLMLRTNLPDHVRRSGSEEVVSVIHAPPNFENWVSVRAPSLINNPFI